MQQGSSGQGVYPIDNNTYNLIQMVASKLEALEVYQKYQKDADEQTRGLIDQMMQQDRQHAEQLIQVLAQKLGGR